MLKKHFTYTDYNGNTREEDHYFHLSKAEIMEMELSTSGGFAEMIQRVVSSQDTPSIIKIFKELILKSYGEKSPDGRRFIKSEELTKEFTETEAYSQLYMELSTDAEAASDFVNGIIPEDMKVEDVDIRKEAADAGIVNPVLRTV